MAKERTASGKQAKKAKLKQLEWAVPYGEWLYKELHATFEGRPSEDEVAELAKDTIYALWWECLKASDEYAATSSDPRIREMYEKCRWLGDDFKSWWLERGKELFVEQQMVPLVKLLELSDELGPEGKPVWVRLEIPLTISKEAIKEQLDYALEQYHPDRKLQRHHVSTARLKIKPGKRPRPSHIRELIELWKFNHENRGRYPYDWQIGEAMGIKAGRGLPPDASDVERNIYHGELGREVNRRLAQADRIIRSAVRGQFPDY